MISLVRLFKHAYERILFKNVNVRTNEERKYCIEGIKIHFNKELVMTKKDNEGFKNSTKCWICDNDYIDDDVKVKDHCHTTVKYASSAHRECNINLTLY